MTERIFDADSHAAVFEAKVLSCQPQDGRFAVILDRTAFFPLGGGQQPDTGTLNTAHVLDVRETQRVITHFTDTPLQPGIRVQGAVDWPQRFRRMQNHTGEHIVSGLIHKLYGLENVGFHMGSTDVTIDFSGELTRAQLNEVESLANEAVWRNVAVTTWYPDPQKLAGISYRSKLELTENVRIVTIEGYDDCACCAPHVARTGEIGIIKLLDFIRYKGGIRVHMLCGADALDDYRCKFENVRSISNALSVQQSDAAKAVQNLNAQLADIQHKLTAMGRAWARELAAHMQAKNGIILFFSASMDTDALREFVNSCLNQCQLCAAFSGCDAQGWNYIAASTTIDLRTLANSLNEGIDGKGGGNARMLQGRASATQLKIQNYFSTYTL